MDFLDAVILGVIEGVTEFIPVSSTGHLILASSLLKLPTTEFLKSFEVVIQLGAILAVLVLYFKKLFNFLLLQRLVVAFLPTALLGLVLYKVIKSTLLGNVGVVVGALFIGGLLLILFEGWYKNRNMAEAEDGRIEDISFLQSFIIGLFQSLSMIPGISRSGATILGGLSLGISRKAIVEFSFLLAIPTMIAATSLDLWESYSTFSSSNLGLLSAGLVTSFLVALAVIKWFLSYIQNHSFVSFGLYRIVVAIAFYAVFIF
jgi:undecaprenyl-diphosphatase